MRARGEHTDRVHMKPRRLRHLNGFARGYGKSVVLCFAVCDTDTTPKQFVAHVHCANEAARRLSIYGGLMALCDDRE